MVLEGKRHLIAKKSKNLGAKHQPIQTATPREDNYRDVLRISRKQAKDPHSSTMLFITQYIPVYYMYIYILEICVYMTHLLCPFIWCTLIEHQAPRLVCIERSGRKRHRFVEVNRHLRRFRIHSDHPRYVDFPVFLAEADLSSHVTYDVHITSQGFPIYESICHAAVGDEHGTGTSLSSVSTSELQKKCVFQVSFGCLWLTGCV